jgi:hypothetical protein
MDELYPCKLTVKVFNGEENNIDITNISEYTFLNAVVESAGRGRIHDTIVLCFG